MRIAIWGLGISGISAYKYLKKQDHQLFLVNAGSVDQWSVWSDSDFTVPREKCFEHHNVRGLIGLVDQIIVSPGVDLRGKMAQELKESGIEIISDVELACHNTKIPVIAITGTNGKTTTTTMLGECLAFAGLKVFIGGNIGVPACDLFKASEQIDYIVLELSSFQLESMPRFHPIISVILNITENHMERYEDFSQYILAKLNIIKNMSKDDLLIYGAGVHVDDSGKFSSVKIKASEISLKGSKLKGQHQLENIFCIEEVFKWLGLDLKIIKNYVKTFSGVKYRLQYLQQIGDLSIYNDAKSTNTAATVSAVRALQGDDLYLILGGKLRGASVDILASLREFNIKKIYLFGEAGPLLRDELSSSFDIELFRGLSDIIEISNIDNKRGSLLFSPGFPSFDQYKSYIERGEDFEKLITLL